MTTKIRSGTAEFKRVGKFGAVGVINTLTDFAVYNILFGLAGLDVRIANIFSTSLAMVFSFFANKRIVFGHKSGSLLKQALTFYAVTAFGLYVLQTGAIHILTDVWTAPLQLVVATVHVLGLGSVFPDTFIINNGAKAIGTLLSLSWNYLTYKKVVFL